MNKLSLTYNTIDKSYKRNAEPKEAGTRVQPAWLNSLHKVQLYENMYVPTLLGGRIGVPHGGCGVEGVEGLERPGAPGRQSCCFLLWVPATWINPVRSCETLSSSILLTCALFTIYVSL